MKNYAANKAELHSKKVPFAFLKNKKETILPVIVVFCLPVLLYMQTLSFDFTYFDDDSIIIDNSTFLSDLKNAPQVFLKDAFLDDSSPLYRPLQTLSYMIDIHLSGENYSRMFHFTNILLLGLIACLLFLFLRKLLIPVKLAVLSTLVYFAHPLFISSVVWIPARGDLLLVFFSLLSFLFLIEYLQKRKIIYLFLNWLAFTFALFCKETAVLLPLLFIIYYFAFSTDSNSYRDRNEKKYLINILLYSISGVFWFWLRSMAIKNISNRNDVGLIPFISNLQTIPEAFTRFFSPFDSDLISNFTLFKTLTGLGIITIIIMLYFTNKERPKKEKIFCLSWFLFLLLPTLLYKDEYIDYLSHRFLLPLIGILLFILFIVPKKWFEKKDSKSSWLLVVIFIFLSFITFVKARAYSDPMTFYNSAIDQNPASAFAYNGRGYLKVSKGDLQGAISDLTKAIELNPNNAEAYTNRGIAYYSKGDFKMAIKDYNKAIELAPYVVYAYINRGNVYYNKGNFKMAIKDYDKSIKMNPNSVNAYTNRGAAYYSLGHLAEAINDYSKAIELDPNLATAYYNRGIAYKAKGMLKEAEQDFKMFETLRLKGNILNGTNTKGHE